MVIKRYANIRHDLAKKWSTRGYARDVRNEKKSHDQHRGSVNGRVFEMSQFWKYVVFVFVDTVLSRSGYCVVVDEFEVFDLDRFGFHPTPKPAQGIYRFFIFPFGH